MKKIIIIGAGPAGITAGYELLKRAKNYEVIILEETQEIGGISRTVNHNGNRMDIGGHRFFSKDDAVVRWWDEIMPRQGKPAYDDKILNRAVTLMEGGPDPEADNRVMLTRTRVSRIYYKKKFFDYPVKMNWNTLKNMGFLTTIQAGLSYLKSILCKRPETSLENFYVNRFGYKLYSMFFESYTEKLWGRHPRDISPDWGAQRVKGLSIVAIIKDIFRKIIPGRKQDNKHIETSLIESFHYPKYGPGQLWEAAAQDFEKMGGTIVKGCKAEKFVVDGKRITQVVCRKDGVEKTYDADIVISSMPLKDLVAGMGQVPEDISKIAQGLPYRDFVTLGLLVNKLNLKNETLMKTVNNIVPDCWIYVQDAGVKLGRIQIFNNWSPYMVANPKNTVWIGLEYFCAEGDKFWNMSEQEWLAFGTEELIKMGVISRRSDVLDFHREKVKKAYPAYFDTYDQIDKLIGYLNEYENLYCIGRNGQHRYNNMDHSMATAFAAVDNILQGNYKNKSAIWEVNTEQEYHEEK